MNLTMNNNNLKKWKDLCECFYMVSKYFMCYPDDPIIKLFGKLSKNLDLKDLKALDLACGVGQYYFFLSEKGLDSYSINNSENVN